MSRASRSASMAQTSAWSPAGGWPVRRTPRGAVAGGCRFGVAAVQVVDGTTVPVVVETRSKPGSWCSRCPDAEVRVDGEVLSNWQGARPSCGTHTVSVSKQGHHFSSMWMWSGQALELPSRSLRRVGRTALDVSPDEASSTSTGTDGQKMSPVWSCRGTPPFASKRTAKPESSSSYWKTARTS